MLHKRCIGYLDALEEGHDAAIHKWRARPSENRTCSLLRPDAIDKPPV